MVAYGDSNITYMDPCTAQARLSLYSMHVHEGVDIGQQIRQLRSGVDVAVGTPGRFIDLINRGNLDLGSVSVALCSYA